MWRHQPNSKSLETDSIHKSSLNENDAKVFHTKHKHVQGGGLLYGLTQISWFNSWHGLFFPLTPIIDTNTFSLKQLSIIKHDKYLKLYLYMV